MKSRHLFFPSIKAHLDSISVTVLCLTRDGNLIKQQQLAMKLLKLLGGKERYQWWVILSIMIQVRV